MVGGGGGSGLLMSFVTSFLRARTSSLDSVAGTRASGLNADVLGARTSRLSTAVSRTLLIEIARLELAARDFDFGADFFEAFLRDFGVMRSLLAAYGSWAVRIRARRRPEYSGKY
jgi:hypothetical protein